MCKGNVGVRLCLRCLEWRKCVLAWGQGETVMSGKDSGDKQPWMVPVLVATVGAISAVIVAWLSKPLQPTTSSTPSPQSPSPYDKYVFISYGVDDEMYCTLNGSGIASQVFGAGQVRVDVTDSVKKGQKNRLHCRVLDKNRGTCYAWDFELQRNGTESLVDQKLSCCNDSCRKNGDEVLNENFDFQA